MITPPKFKASFLLPQYWLIWLGAAFVYLLTWLPLSVLQRLGRGLGPVLIKLAPKRAAVARRNIALCYPHMSPSQQHALLQENIKRTGMALFETAMGWWWPNWRIKPVVRVEGFEHVQQALAQGRGVFAMAIHNLNIEFACRGMGYTCPMIAFYRKHDNPLMDYLQYHGRARSNKYMIHKRNAKALLAAMEQNELCIYLPDQDYGRAQSIFVPFGGVAETATTTATMMFIRRSNAVPMLVASQYEKNGYVIRFYPAMPELREMNDEQALTLLNQRILDIINEQPESYLWMHKRFKTRPNENDPSLYA